MSISKIVVSRRVSLPLAQLLRTQSTFAHKLKESIDVSTDRNVRPFEDIPGPKGLPYIGSFHRFMLGGGLKNLHNTQQKLFDEFGPIFKETLFGKTAVHLLDPRDIEKVLRSEGKYPKKDAFGASLKFCKENDTMALILLDGSDWKHVRSSLAPKLLRPKEVYDNIDNFNSVVDDALESIRYARGSGTTEGDVASLDDILAAWATESVGTLLFDARIGLYEDPPNIEAQQFIQAVKDSVKLTQKLETGPERMFYKRFNTPSLKKFYELSNFILGVTRKYLMAKLEEVKQDLNNPDKALDGKAVSFLAYLLIKGNLTQNELVSNVWQLFGAGVDTTSNTLLWALYNLARYPHIQERLHQEIISVIGKDGYLTAKDMGKIPYTKAFLKESLRRDGIILAAERVLDQDVVVRGFNVPSQTKFSISMYCTNHSESYFKDPEDFRPERWLRKTGDQSQPFSHLPFGFGPRMCIGKRVAELEMHLFLSKVVQKFKLEYNHEPVQKTMTFFILPDKKIKINFIDRE